MHRSSTECRRGSMMMSASSSSLSASTSATKRKPSNHEAADVSDDEAQRSGTPSGSSPVRGMAQGERSEGTDDALSGERLDISSGDDIGSSSYVSIGESSAIFHEGDAGGAGGGDSVACGWCAASAKPWTKASCARQRASLRVSKQESCRTWKVVGLHGGGSDVARRKRDVGRLGRDSGGGRTGSRLTERCSVRRGRSRKRPSV
jgi:hypothetical protein